MDGHSHLTTLLLKCFYNKECLKRGMNLTCVDPLIKLKLVKEISLVSEAFKEAIVNIEVEEKFLAELEAKKLKVSCLKKDYREHKEDKVAQTQSMDDQIMQLQLKRREIFRALETIHH
ncbi:uncharacterized protein LOC130979052 [Arachis stenosperma]|uniref:uncharacterized protein LOC130979052 n=1 Tax=Arachis stenosperma TaxID=217475 RepID=UPI0025ACDA23|nr:uncharacterized protein LOC130979052 [Arachis stenosperma]